MQEQAKDRALGALLGLAVGDALGTTVEFHQRGTFAPVTTLTGGGPFHLKPGEWTDDTSMALCLADSLLACQGLNERDLMDRFVRWMERGENSHNGKCFDIGIATKSALLRYQQTHDPLAGSQAERSAGNGSLMRLSPVSIFAQTPEIAADLGQKQSQTTHAAPACLQACAYYAQLLWRAIAGERREAVLAPQTLTGTPEMTAIAAGTWREKTEKQIHSTGYVIHTLEAALWCVRQSDDFSSAVLRAVNLGHDADTVGAVTGQLAGALWGMQGIPAEWLEKLAWRQEIQQKAERLWELRSDARAFQEQ